MSVMLLNLDHIDLLVSVCVRMDMDMIYCVRADGEGYLYDATLDTDWTGALLVNENVRSVTHTHPDEDFDNLPGAVNRALPEDYRFKVLAEDEYSWVDVLKACDGYEYNSCDHEGYENSRARYIIQAIRRRAVAELDGYETSKAWNYRRPAEVTAD